ncbi:MULTISPECIES: DUF6518 family protein [unclassified Modestobacter]|uniref:DUF6518 family protein n=1 Tax=unclassified Modestobacter TaxID=2643866 RepID=UPI0022AB29F7|nr:MULTISPECIES: DUF6518 family protein [unclassified Modestobacter]MCZ2824168.1 DUF6518 family protein [Modestobacter sp. VKM Ac-2981]MCZ2854304.1 DUF6518 family protein [Modestobacter sp. VKM Ac-2982]
MQLITTVRRGGRRWADGGGTIGAVTATIEAPARRRAPPVLALLAGLLTGAAAKAGDESGWRWAADLGSYPAAWVLVVALIGWSAPSPAAAALRSGVFFAAMTVAYYAWAALVLDFGWSVRLLVAWLVLSATAVPATAVAAHVATRGSGWLPGALLAMAAGITLGGGALADAGDHPVQAVVDVVVALVLVVVLARDLRTRLWAAALTLPLTGVAAVLLGLLRDLLG